MEWLKKLFRREPIVEPKVVTFGEIIQIDNGMGVYHFVKLTEIVHNDHGTTATFTSPSQHLRINY